jgi:hypothetical protein
MFNSNPNVDQFAILEIFKTGRGIGTMDEVGGGIHEL